MKRVMDTRSKNPVSFPKRNINPMNPKIEYRRSYSLGHNSSNSSRRIIPASYFGLESLLMLICLTASLLILPLVLPPLPPPPFMLLLLPIGILGVLMILAFVPSIVHRDINSSCAGC